MIASVLLTRGRPAVCGAQIYADVAFDDSSTDGAQSTADTNNRWPDHLRAA